MQCGGRAARVSARLTSYAALRDEGCEFTEYGCACKPGMRRDTLRIR